MPKEGSVWDSLGLGLVRLGLPGCAHSSLGAGSGQDRKNLRLAHMPGELAVRRVESWCCVGQAGRPVCDLLKAGPIPGALSDVF